MEININKTIILKLKRCDQDLRASLYIGALEFICLDTVANNYLHPEEAQYFSKLTVSRRQNSYLLGRYCAKNAAVSLYPNLQPIDINIARGVFGFPYVHNVSSQHYEAFNLTISHSENLGAAIAYPLAHPMAIDIEKICSDKIPVIKTQLQDQEILLVQQLFSTQEHAFVALWAMKEALSKVLKCGMMISFELLEISNIVEEEPGIYISYFKHFSQYKAVTFEVSADNSVWMCSIVLPKKTVISNLTQLRVYQAYKVCCQTTDV